MAFLLESCGLSADVMDRHPHEFSGGQRQRISIARALAVEPKVLVLDEPVSALDVSIQAQILTLLQGLQSQFGLTYLFIGHNLAVVEGICDRIAVMYRGEVVEEGPTEAVIHRPEHPYTARLIAATPVPDPTAQAHRMRRLPMTCSGSEPRSPHREFRSVMAAGAAVAAIAVTLSACGEPDERR